MLTMDAYYVRTCLHSISLSNACGRLTHEGRQMAGPLSRAAEWIWDAATKDEMGPNIWEGQEGGRWDTQGKRCTFTRTLAARHVLAGQGLLLMFCPHLRRSCGADSS